MVIPDSTKANPRADSYSLYMNYVADKILQNILPKSKLESRFHRIKRDKGAGTAGAQAKALKCGTGVVGGYSPSKHVTDAKATNAT